MEIFLIKGIEKLDYHSVLNMPAYLIYAFLSLIPFLGLTLTNKIVTNSHNGYVYAAWKCVFYVPICFVLVCVLGHVNTLFSVFQSPTATVSLIISCFLSGICWISYLYALERSPFSLFNATNLSTRVLFVNLANAIVSLSLATNGLKPLNIVLYFVAFAILLGILISVFLHPEAKEKGGTSWIYALCIFGVANAVNVFIVNQVLVAEVIYPEVTVFYQSIGSLIACFIASFVKGKQAEFKTFSFRELLVIAFSGACETGFYYLLFCSLNAEGAVPAISNIIAYIGLFLLVELFEIVVEKKRPNSFHGVLLVLFAASLILTCLAGMI